MQDNLAADQYLSLTSFAVIRATGADARDFLHNQLTNDVLAQPDKTARLSGYCSPKGRLLATLLVWTHGTDVTLFVPSSIAVALQKRLSMYVLRAKVKVQILSATVCGYIGEHPPFAWVQWFGSAPATPWSVVHRDDDVLIRFADDDAGPPRWMSVTGLSLGSVSTVVDDALWRWRDVRAGIPWIEPATQERFVPQMVNLDALAAIDFKKGCFPGQEVVARSQYLGKLKRRTRLVSVCSDASVLPGADLFSAEKSEPVGLVVNVEKRPGSDTLDLLVELPLEIPPELSLGAPGGPRIVALELPYALPDNEVFVRPKL